MHPEVLVRSRSPRTLVPDPDHHVLLAVSLIPTESNP